MLIKDVGILTRRRKEGWGRKSLARHKGGFEFLSDERVSTVNTIKFCEDMGTTSIWGFAFQWKGQHLLRRASYLLTPDRTECTLCISPLCRVSSLIDLHNKAYVKAQGSSSLTFGVFYPGLKGAWLGGR